MKIKLFVSHRIDQENKVIKNEIITPVYCGAIYKNDEWQEGLIGDDTGDNISEKRMSYCELTVQYWAWKNVEADYYGLCHYRRYLSLTDIDGIKNEQNQIYLPFIQTKDIQKYKFDDVILLKKYCQKYDAIFSKPVFIKNVTAMGANPISVLDLWRTYEGIFFDEYAIDILLKSIKEKSPSYYGDAISYLASKWHRGYNCFIMKDELFQSLCDFEFKILSDIEGKINNNNYTRTLAYMGEILFGIYQYSIENKKTKIKYTNLIYFEGTNLKISSFIKYITKLILEKIISINLRRKIKKWRRIICVNQ